MMFLVDGFPRELCEVQLNRLRAAGTPLQRVERTVRKDDKVHFLAGGKWYCQGVTGRCEETGEEDGHQRAHKQ